MIVVDMLTKTIKSQFTHNYIHKFSSVSSHTLFIVVRQKKVELYPCKLNIISVKNNKKNSHQYSKKETRKKLQQAVTSHGMATG